MDLTALAAPKSASKKAATNYPTVSGMEAQVAEFIDLSDKFEALEADLKLRKAELAEAGLEEWFNSRGVESSVVLLNESGAEREAMASVSSRYYGFSAERSDEVKKIVGKKFFDEQFEEKVELKIDMSDVEKGNRQAVIDGIVKAFAEAGEAPTAIKPKVNVSPLGSFHAARHALKVKQNLELNEILKNTVSIKRRNKVS